MEVVGNNGDYQKLDGGAGNGRELWASSCRK
jgi:hypothetical protein